MAEYPGSSRGGLSPNRSARNGTIKLFIIHHYASTQDAESAWARFNSSNDRDVSPNYQVNADGSVFEVVPPRNWRAWTTGAIDHQAITCETQNTTGAPSWGISEASHEAIAQLVAWAHREHGIPLQYGAANGTNVTRPGVIGHRDVMATACPGPSMDINWIIERAKQIVSGSPEKSSSAAFRAGAVARRRRALR